MVRRIPRGLLKLLGWCQLGGVLIEHVRRGDFRLLLLLLSRAYIPLCFHMLSTRCVSGWWFKDPGHLPYGLLEWLYSGLMRYLILTTMKIHGLHSIIIYLAYQIILGIVCS